MISRAYQDPTTTFPFSDADFPRRNQVSNKLADDLNRYLTNYRTTDRKGLTDGEVIIGIGFLLANHVGNDAARVRFWLTQVGVAALDATKDKP